MSEKPSPADKSPALGLDPVHAMPFVIAVALTNQRQAPGPVGWYHQAAHQQGVLDPLSPSIDSSAESAYRLLGRWRLLQQMDMSGSLSLGRADGTLQCEYVPVVIAVLRALQSRAASREYRKRKKQNIEEMEGKLGHLSAENADLKRRLQELEAARAETGVLRPELLECWRNSLVALQNQPAAANPSSLEPILAELQGCAKHLVLDYKDRHTLQMDFGQWLDDSPAFDSAEWLEMVADLGLSDAARARLEAVLGAARIVLAALDQEHRVLREDLRSSLRQLGGFARPLEGDLLLPLATRLGQLQRNCEAHWAEWDKAMLAVADALTAAQKAKLLLRRRTFLENSAVLTRLWRALNQRASVPTPAPHPALAFSLLPAPVHLYSRNGDAR